MMKKILVVALALVAVAWPFGSLVKAADFRSDKNNLTISDVQGPKDLYAASDTVIIDSPVKGDLSVAGNSIIINGDVEDNLFVAGGTVTIRGTVGRHLRVVGSTVTLSGKVNGDLFVAANKINITSGAVISGGTYLAGNLATLDGSFSDLKAVVNQLTIGGTAKLNNGLTYWSPDTASIDSQAKVTGAVTYHQRAKTNYSYKFSTLFSIFGLFCLIGSMLLLLLLAYLIRPILDKSLKHVSENFWASLGLGFLALIIAPIVLVLLMITVIGIPIAMFGLVVWILALALGSLLAKLVIGSWLVKMIKKQDGLKIDYQSIILGVLVYAIIGFIPVIGPTFNFIIFLVAFGSVIAQLKLIRAH
ncbi:MAG TPA: polymer-forming cytoskeletal protein [Candidatus Saccharimonadales bacterium]|nr:polymer-forming cytoskeletal protein [Candidatus Saccharimonadales bacterium]